MLTATLRRLAQATVTLVGGAAIVFALLVQAPGDPARRILGARGMESPQPETVQAVRDELGLDDPLPVRFWDFLTGLLQGDLGLSWRTGRPVMEEFATRLPATLILAAAALLLAVGLSLLLGLVAAARADRWPDQLSRGLSLTFLVVPGFLFGIVVLDVVVVSLGVGRVISDGTWGTVLLPALTLALGQIAAWSRILRAGLLEAGSAAYLKVSAARGASRTRQLLVHQLPNAIPPYLTVIGLGTAALLGGAPIVESVFTWPGVGRFTVEAVNARDLPVVVGFAVIAIAIYVLASLLVDTLNALIDPRQRSDGSRSNRRRRLPNAAI